MTCSRSPRGGRINSQGNTFAGADDVGLVAALDHDRRFLDAARYPGLGGNPLAEEEPAEESSETDGPCNDQHISEHDIRLC